MEFGPGQPFSLQHQNGVAAEAYANSIDERQALYEYLCSATRSLEQERRKQRHQIIFLSDPLFVQELEQRDIVTAWPCRLRHSLIQCSNMVHKQGDVCLTCATHRPTLYWGGCKPFLCVNIHETFCPNFVPTYGTYCPACAENVYRADKVAQDLAPTGEENEQVPCLFAYSHHCLGLVDNVGDMCFLCWQEGFIYWARDNSEVQSWHEPGTIKKFPCREVYRNKCGGKVGALGVVCDGCVTQGFLDLTLMDNSIIEDSSTVDEFYWL